METNRTIDEHIEQLFQNGQAIKDTPLGQPQWYLPQEKDEEIIQSREKIQKKKDGEEP